MSVYFDPALMRQVGVLAARARKDIYGEKPLAQSFREGLAIVKEVARYALKYPIGTVPRPPHWSGFRVSPLQIEFWRDGAFRLHDRLVYRRPDESAPWRTEKLFP